MEADHLMRAVLQSFVDADLRAEVLPRPELECQSRTANTGTGPSRPQYDVTTQAVDGRQLNQYKHSETMRNDTSSGFGHENSNSTSQAVDGRYATVYRVHHCKMIPTSPPLMTSEFPPQRADVAYGCDNFQVGGAGSGESGAMPVKTSSYRGGINWSNRGDVCTPRMSRCSDPFANSLRKYPPVSVSPERSEEVLERLVTYAMPRAYRSPRVSPRCSPHRQPRHEPYEDTSCRPRAPEEYPTRDGREDYNHFRQSKIADIRHVREMSRRIRKSLKSISSYTHTHTLSAYLDGMENEREIPIVETSETEHEDVQPTPEYNYPVDTTVQAVVQMTSHGVEAKLLPSPNTIAVPLTATPSSRLTTSVPNPGPIVTKSVQTLPFPGRSVETVTSNTEVLKHKPANSVAKKSKSLSDFRLTRDFKSEILSWLDDTSDPKIKEIKKVVSRNLRYRLMGLPTIGSDKIRVKVGNCLKSHPKISLKDLSSIESNKNNGLSNTRQSKDERKVKNSTIITDQTDFDGVIKEWLNNIPINKHDVKKELIYDTFVNRLKSLVFEKSKNYIQESLRADIFDILEQVPINISIDGKTVYLNRITDDLMCKLGNVMLVPTEMKPSACNMSVSARSNTNLPKNHQPTEIETNDLDVGKISELLKKQNVADPEMIKQTIVDLVDILKDSNTGLENVANSLNNATKLTDIEAKQYAAQSTDNCKDLRYKNITSNFRTQPVTVFMVQNVSRNYITRTSGTNMSQHCIRNTLDKDFEENFNRYKAQLAQRIDQWLSDLAILRGNDTDFRQAAVLDLATDIIDRQKYLKFNKNRSSDTDELEHLKYQIFKWMKRYVDEDNMETVHHAAELMEMIRNIPIPLLSRSQVLLYESNSRIRCHNGHYEPGISSKLSKDKVDKVYRSKLDPGQIHQRKRSQHCSVSTQYMVSKESSCNYTKHESRKQRKVDERPSAFNRYRKMPNQNSTSEHNNSDSSRCSLENQKNSHEITKYKYTKKIERADSETQNSFNIYSREDTVHDNTDVSSKTIRQRQISQTSFVINRFQEDLHNTHSDISFKDSDDKPSTSVSLSNDEVYKSMSSSSKINQEEPQNDQVVTNYIVHKVVCTNKSHDKRNSSKNKKKSSKSSQESLPCEAKCASMVQSPCDKKNSRTQNESIGCNQPGTSGLLTPGPGHSGKQSSASAQLMAEWRPPPVFTPPLPGRPLIDQVHEEFQEYLKNWSQQIPIPASTPEEIKVAEKARLGILNGIWKIMTKLKTQPVVFQNKFYYDDVLGKEVDTLFDCLPQTQELEKNRLTLKAQLLEKISDMNDLIKEIEMPQNYKEILAQKAKLLEEKKLRNVVRLDRESPAKIFEEMLKYCTLDDFLARINYKESNPVLEKAYHNKLLRRTQEFIDEVKAKHGKEMENLLEVWKESDIFDVLHKVPIPTEDSISEDADEIFLGLEIKQWMTDLPIVKNDDGNEQRQRRRLRDELTKKIHEMQKRLNISNCCGNTQVKEEISYFLDMVPLEKDQDLKINEMVEELTNRLKSRLAAGGRKKSVAFQDGSRNQSRLLNRSELTNATTPSDIFSPGDEWAFHKDEDAQYRGLFQNAPVCSTRIAQPGEEWGVEEDQDAQYRAFFKDGVPCSSMIEPQVDYGPGSTMPPDFHHSYDQQPSHFVYSPGRFHESARGGSFGYPIRGSLPYADERYQYPNVIRSPVRQGLPSSRIYGSPTNIPLSDSQYHSIPEQQNFMPGVDAHQVAPRIMQRPAFDQQGLEWVAPSGASGFVSMPEQSFQRPPEYMSVPRYSIGRPAMSHRSQMDPNMSLGNGVPQEFRSIGSSQLPGEAQAASGFHSSARSEQPYMEPPPEAFIPEEPRFSRGSPARSARSDNYGSISMGPQELREIEASVQVHEVPRSRQQEMKGQRPSGFISMVSHQKHTQPPLDSRRNQSLPQPVDSRSGKPLIRISPPREVRITDQDEIQEASQHGSLVRAENQLQQGPQSHQSSRNHAPTDRFTDAASGAPSSPQRARFAASNAPSSEISNQPAFYSTPNQAGSIPPPPNIRERRQMEKERFPARRLDMDAEEGEGEERCHCRERFSQWNRRMNCQTCDECIHGGYYPYLYPYPYLPYGRPPFPPHCRR